MYCRLARFMVQAGTVDLDAGEIYISRSVSWDHWTRHPYLVDMVKTEDSYGIIHLTEDLKKMLKEMKPKSAGCGLVFVNNRGQMPKYNAITSAFNDGFEALDLPWRVTHICRHTHGTLGLVANHGNLAKVQASLRHGDRRTTEGYAKVIACLDKSTVTNVSALMGFDDSSQSHNADRSVRKENVRDKFTSESLPKSLPNLD